MEFKRFKSENPVWGYFQRSTNGQRAKCDTCGTNISCKGGSTGAMRNHLHLKHKIQVGAKTTKAHVPSLTVRSTGKSRIDNIFRPKKVVKCFTRHCLPFSPLLWKLKEHSMHADSIATKLRYRLNQWFPTFFISRPHSKI